MSNKVIVVWLILLTAYCAMNEYRVSHNVEARKKQFDSRKEVFENLNSRIDHIGKYTHEHPG
jgi:hypothetical protein